MRGVAPIRMEHNLQKRQRDFKAFHRLIARHRLQSQIKNFSIGLGITQRETEIPVHRKISGREIGVGELDVRVSIGNFVAGQPC